MLPKKISPMDLNEVIFWTDLSGFYPTALKGCRGIVFTHGVWMGGFVIWSLV